MRRFGWLMGLAACAPADDAGPDASATLPPRPDHQTCRPAPLDPDTLPNLVGRPALDGLTAPGARALIEAPRGGAWLVAAGDTVLRVPLGPGAGAPTPWLRLPWRSVVDVALGATGRYVFVVSAGADGVVASRFPLEAQAPAVDERAEEVLASWPGEAGSLALTEAGGLYLAGSDLLYVPDPEGESPAVEPFAAGLAPPARCSADGAEVWCLVGADVHRLRRGDRVGEGTRMASAAAGCDPVAGHVYRGAHWPELFGAYVFAAGCGEVVGVRVTEAGPLTRSVLRRPEPVALLTRDGQGRLLALDPAGHAQRLEVAVPDTHLGWPDRLSDTRCFTALDPLTPGPDLVPYELNAPLWTDGAEKTRFFVVPPGTRVDAGDAGPWEFPLGSVLVKHFALPDARGRLVGVETRFMVRQPFGWSFHTYRWDDEGREAWLLDGLDEARRPWVLPDGTALDYLYPSRFDCHTCHQRRAEVVLGPRTAQLDRRSARGADQLAAFHEAGLLSRQPVGEPLPDPDDPALPLAERARAWLHANCAHCHQPGGWTPPELGLDLRFHTPLAQTGLCAPARYPGFGLAEARLVPGRPEASNLFQRLTTEGYGRMPLLGTSRPDPRVETLIGPWITTASGCDEMP